MMLSAAMHEGGGSGLYDQVVILATGGRSARYG
jgi:hypothetical protein